VIASLTRADLEEIMEVRDLVDPYVAQRAAERADPAGVERLRDALEREERAVPMRSSQKFAMANHDFRVALLSLAANSRLSQTASRYDSQLQALRRATLEKRANRETVVRHHHQLVDAVARGDAAAAGTAMRTLMVHASAAILALGTSRAAHASHVRGGRT
jgi:DNA-binding GntR family transcriptional regulator